MEKTRYRVHRDHRSEFPEPLTIARGDSLKVGERYDGPEGWDHWFFCQAPGTAGGWVPEQMLERTGDHSARALEDYTARELDVTTGEIVLGSRTLNGWVWCEHTARPESGWVPLAHLEPVPDAS